MVRHFFVYLVLIIHLALSGCATLNANEIATPIPEEKLPTAIAQTLQASGIGLSIPTAITTPTRSKNPSNTSTKPSSTATQTLIDTPTNSPTTKGFENKTELVDTISPSEEATPSLTATFIQIINPTSPIEAPHWDIPDARVQIYQLGERSFVTSPIAVTANLSSQIGKVARIELWGEDGRLLARHVRTFENIPWQNAKVGVYLEFEISKAAEEARLVISVEDSHGRLIDVNSVDLILLSTGMTELKPTSALGQRIVIQEPAPNTLIQGGKLIASGRVKPYNPENLLKLMLIGEDGRLLGQRLASVSITIPGDYGVFIAEIPYIVKDITPALLVVQEDGGPLSEIVHLSSLDVILTP